MFWELLEGRTMTFAWTARKKSEKIKQRDLIVAVDGSGGWEGEH